MKNHGDGVKDVALLVDDVDKAFSSAVERGAIALMAPIELKDEKGIIKRRF